VGDDHYHQDPTSSAEDYSRPENTSSNSNSNSGYNELVALRKKFDAVVEYTVHLTAERDTIMSQLEDVQKELNVRTNAKGGVGEIKESPLRGRREDKSERKKNAPTGFSFQLVLFTAILAWIVGRFFV